jgi:hypothetical protein
MRARGPGAASLAAPGAPETTAAARKGCGTHARPAICSAGWATAPACPPPPAGPLPARPWGSGSLTKPLTAGLGAGRRVPSRGRALPPNPAWAAGEQPSAPAHSGRGHISGALGQRAARQSPRRGRPACPGVRRRPTLPSSPGLEAPPPERPLPPRTPSPCRPRQAGCPVDRRAGGPVPQSARAGRRRVVSGDDVRCWCWRSLAGDRQGRLLPTLLARHHSSLASSDSCIDQHISSQPCRPWSVPYHSAPRSSISPYPPSLPPAPAPLLTLQGGQAQGHPHEDGRLRFTAHNYPGGQRPGLLCCAPHHGSGAILGAGQLSLACACCAPLHAQPVSALAAPAAHHI